MFHLLVILLAGQFQSKSAQDIGHGHMLPPIGHPCCWILHIMCAPPPSSACQCRIQYFQIFHNLKYWRNSDVRPHKSCYSNWTQMSHVNNITIWWPLMVLCAESVDIANRQLPKLEPRYNIFLARSRKCANSTGNTWRLRRKVNNSSQHLHRLTVRTVATLFLSLSQPHHQSPEWLLVTTRLSILF